jgi:hypothetical protein
MFESESCGPFVVRNSTELEKPVQSAAVARPSERVGSKGTKTGRVRRCGTGETKGGRVGDEMQRSHLIDELSRILRDPSIPEPARSAGLTLIGWLARRMPGEASHAIGVAEARESHARICAAKKV